jgi:FkbH-like protein
MVRIAILGNYATQFLLKSLKKEFISIEAEFYLADYNSIDMEIIDENSALIKFKPKFIIWHESTLALRDQFYQSTNREIFADDYIHRIENLNIQIQKLIPGAIVLFPNHDLKFSDNVFGHFSGNIKQSWEYQIKKINFLLHDLVISTGNFYLINSFPLIHLVEPITDYTLVINADLHYSLDYLNWLTKEIYKIIDVFQGKFKKCIILDLDNTLWGGIIGDDGIGNIQIGNLGIGKAFSRFQKWILELKKRGIILAVCSKNEDSIAKQPFIEHKEMILKLEDFAVFMANWESKADNINHIQKILNIGFDSMVFIDDNPAEREIVKKHIPEITVPDLPADPAYYLSHLISLNLFETISYSTNDEKRTKQYQEEAKRIELANSISNMEDYWESLEMSAEIKPININDIERVAQLTQRSNQFNLRTIRYTSEEISQIVSDTNYLTATVELTDKFGNYGLISVIIIRLNTNQTAQIDTWIMSCRVLKRKVEFALMNYLVDQLLTLEYKNLKGEYIPTPKNQLVKNLLIDLGMTSITENQYSLDLNNYSSLTHNIKIK